MGKKKNKRKKLKTLKKQLEKQLKPKLRPPEKRAKPPLSSQTKTSTSEVTNRKPTAGTIRSVIFTLKCTETSCKKKEMQNNKKHNLEITTTPPKITSYFLKITSFTSFLLDFWILFGFGFLTYRFWIIGFFSTDFSRINK